MGAILLYLVGGALTLALTVIRGRTSFFNRCIGGQVIRLLFPILVVIGKCIGITSDLDNRLTAHNEGPCHIQQNTSLGSL